MFITPIVNDVFEDVNISTRRHFTEEIAANDVAAISQPNPGNLRPRALGHLRLLKEDATYSMPPWRHWYQGRDAIRWFFNNVWKSYRGFRLVPTYANDQPAFGLYTRANEPTGWNAHSLQVLSVHDGRISALTMFMKPLTATVFPAFRLPLILEN